MKDYNQLNFEIRNHKEDIQITKRLIEKNKSRLTATVLAQYENDIVNSENQIKLLTEELNKVLK